MHDQHGERGVRRLLSGLRGSRTVPRTRWTSHGVWRPTPASLSSLLVGLWMFGAGDAFLLASRLGATPWTVLAQGVSLHTGLTIGWSTFVVSVSVLLLWIPLRQKPGLGTVLNIIVISIAIEVTVRLLPEPDVYASRLGFVFIGIAMIGVGSGFYLTAGHGPGPRDGWMTGLHGRTGWPVGRIRLAIELTVLAVGWLLGGTVGVGTLLFALLIGRSVALALAGVARIAPAKDATS